MTPKVTSDFWVGAYRRRLGMLNIPVFITARGDATAGAILIKLNTLDGNAELFQRSFDLDGARIWVTLAQGSDRDIDEMVRKQRQFDPDIWVIEVEDRAGRHLLGDEGLSS
ncbi:GTP-binding protein [Amylibacter marinus]|uniref:GTP-binding protein n=1 Tax=Amylibacter marinus TaxID=1475483 RepID=A0ABQ5VUY7_9RHOB|nr:DUF1491 family protein [Amylibacter marinus]GLQ35043.1 GTP-binding protein [Amylibacter marinus]